MTDREKALDMGRLFEDFCGVLNDCQRSLFAKRVAEAILEARAQEADLCFGTEYGGGSKRAAELRAQKEQR